MSAPKPHIGVIGHKGRLGSRIIQLLEKQNDFTFEPIPRDSTYEQPFTVIIDVSKPEGTQHMLTSLLKLNKSTPVVIGVTGDLPNEMIQQYSQKAPVALISNFSFGVPQFIRFLQTLQNEESWKISMTERHHVHKVDKPSGTAKTLASLFKSEIEIDSVREGEIIGEHDVTLETEYEKLVISHVAKDRAIFAAGALRYAAWLPLQDNGLYTAMEKKKIAFAKYEGCGNDFVFVDNKAFTTREAKTAFVKKVCPRAIGIGADGVIFVEKRGNVVYWEYCNSDGSLVAMCGNGARCVATYSLHQKWDCRELINSHDIKQKFTVETDGNVCVEMPKAILENTPEGLHQLKENSSLKNFEFESLYTVGVPHAIVSLKGTINEPMTLQFIFLDVHIDSTSPNPVGEAIRKVIDVNTNVYQLNGDTLSIRTYERGVYDETLACGSGCCSVAYHLWSKTGEKKEQKYYLKVRSGLIILVRVEADGTIYLSGPTRRSFEGTVEL